MPNGGLSVHLKSWENLLQGNQAPRETVTVNDADREHKAFNNPTLATLFKYDKSKHPLHQHKKKRNKKGSTTDLLIEV